jgi:hypothetical protein
LIPQNSKAKAPHEVAIAILDGAFLASVALAFKLPQDKRHHELKHPSYEEIRILAKSSFS